MEGVTLITGGGGFIGANLVRKLTASGHQVRVFDNFSTGDPRNLEKLPVEIIVGDIRDNGALSRALDDGVTQVVHLAAFGSVIESVSNVIENFEVNVAASIRLLHLCVKKGIRNFIFASSGGAVIGEATPPADEESLPKPISPYGASKLAVEAYCHAFGKTYRLNTVCLRFSNVYGPYSHRKRSVITNFIRAILEDKPMTIYGDGNATRDFLYVDDLCEAICRASETELPPGTILHLATGRETSVLELANILRQVAGRPHHPIRFEPKRVGEIERSCAGFQKARELIGFEPSTPLSEGLKLTLDWFVTRFSRGAT